MRLSVRTRGSPQGDRRSGLTLSELCIVLVVLVFLFGGVMPALVGRSREQAGRVKCASNLRQIGQGIQMYANENKGVFPRTVYDGVGGTPTEYTGWQAPNPFGPGGPAANDVTAAFFLLLRTQDLTSEVFLCPQGPHQDRWQFNGGPVAAVSNFPGRQFVTYSYINPYPSQAAVAQGFKLNYTLTSDFAIAADMNPGPPGVVAVAPNSPRVQMSQANTRNHNGDGQNVLYADGHVEFQNTPFCGMQRGTPPAQTYRDNIYTFGAGFGAATAGVGVVGAAADPLDSILLPWSPDAPAMFGAVVGGTASRGATWLFVAVGAAVMFGVVVMVLALVRGTNAPPAAMPPGAPPQLPRQAPPPMPPLQ